MDSYHSDTYQSHNVVLPERMNATTDSAAPAQGEIKVSHLARRIHGWSWQAFPIGMGTGAVYVTLSGLKEHANALTHVETFFYFLNMALFLLNVTTLAIQMIVYPTQALRLVKDPVKGIFVPLVVLSFATIIIGTIKYAVPSGHVGPGFVYALFWVYVAFAVIVCFPMLMVWFNQPHDLRTFTPAWAFLMLVGVVAFNVLDVVPAREERAVGVLLTGYVFQGLGFFVTFFYICIYLIRSVSLRSAPPGFTALALMKLGENAAEILPLHGLVSEQAGQIWYATSVMSGLMLFGLAVFLFVFGVLPYWFKVHKHLSEILGCWALTFPNVGWISTIRVLGDVFKLNGFYVWHLAMTVLMCAVWLVLFALTAYAFVKGKIFLARREEVLQDALERKLAMALLHRSPRHSESGSEAYNKEAQGQV
ncbi:voltage-dependent anion channel-domain-containing protein [Cubamyces lactineus]|nr:voltage-dependent anion channel-domain-containing protein [Cubamyces lactineus]